MRGEKAEQHEAGIDESVDDAVAAADGHPGRIVEPGDEERGILDNLSNAAASDGQHQPLVDGQAARSRRAAK